jgi:hypothetical protein
MNINCEIVREKLAGCINEHIDPKEDAVLSEHLKQCPQCSKYYNELKADDEALGDLADSMRPVISRIETNINKELETEKTKTVPIYNNKVLRLAAAALILFGIFAVLNQFGIIPDGTNTAWAKVSKIILEVRTITFNISIGKGSAVFCTASGRKFKQELPNGVEAIFDYDKRKMLLLNPNDKTSMNIELSGLPIVPSNMFENLKSAIEILKVCPDTIVKRLGKKIINNKEAAGIHVYLDDSIDIKIWYVIKEDVPVLIEASKMMGQTNVIFSDFNFDAIADEAVFNLNVPENYTKIESVKMDLKNLSEQDLIEGLKAWAGLMDNKFPEKLDLAIIQEHSKVIEQTLNEKGVSDAEKALIGIKIMRGLMFISQLEVKWQYNSDNTKLGDTDTAIFWYQPEQSKTYRVLYGDLHIADVEPENLPKTP